MAGFLTATPALAENIESLLPYVVDNHDRVRADEARLRAARNRAREALGDWYPTLSQTANAGTERQQNDNGDDSSTGFNEYDISLTQLLWDFGSTNAAIDKARLQVEEARLTLVETRQSLILEAITAYMNLIRADQSLKFAVQSEENVRRQTGLEEALVGLGSGFSSDVLQAKSQLAGAQARRAGSEGGLTSALNRYRAVFGRVPDDIEALETVPFPAPFLPTSLTQATDIALEMNPALKNAILAADIAMEDVRIARADNFTPRIEATGERKFKKNVGGTIGSEQETLAKVEMTFDFNLGFTAINTLKASEQDLSATTYSAADTRRNIEEQVRNAWQQLETSKRTAAHLDNQSNIEAAFLEVARNERQLGNRSLIDVLTAETTLVNARSDALSARTDVVIAAYALLSAAGLLDYDVIKESKGIEPPVHAPDMVPAPPAAAPVPPVTPSPPGPDQGQLYDPDITNAPARSAAELKRLIDEPDKLSDVPASVQSTELASISTRLFSAKERSEDLTFDISGLESDERDFSASLEIQVEFASTVPVSAIAPDMPVVTDDSDTPVSSVPMEVALLPVRVAAPILDVDGAYNAASTDDEPPAPVISPIKAASLKQETPSSASAPVQETAELVEVVQAEPQKSALSGILDTLEEAHQAYQAAKADDGIPPLVVQAVALENTVEIAAAPAEPLPEPVPDADVPDTAEDAVSSTFSSFFQFMEEAHQRRLAADAGEPLESPDEAAPVELASAPDVPETFPEAVEATFATLGDAMSEAAETAETPAAPVETARLPQQEDLSPMEADASPDSWEKAVGSTFGGFLDFLEEAHQRKLESEREKSAPSKPAKQVKAPDVRQAAQKTTEPDAVAVTEAKDEATSSENPFGALFSSIGSVFGDIEISYRPLRDDERSFRD